MKLILSIKPEFCEQIFHGNKRYEYRRRIFKKDVESVLVYATSPVCKIVGEFQIMTIIQDTPDALWSRTKEFSGISHDYYMKYFHDIESAYALQILNPKLYDKPIDPKKIDTKFVAPQSYKYIEI